MKTTIDLGTWLANARQALQDVSDQPGLEAQALAAHSLGRSRAWLAAHPEHPLSSAQQAGLDGLLLLLKQGAPLPYLTGKQEFYGLEFEVTPAVLIPRPETELLVERALEACQRLPAPRVADIGAGSGCIAVSLAKHAPHAKVVAVERSWEAIQVARRNARHHAVAERVHFVQADLLTALAGPIDVLCANLPYIPTETLAGLDVRRHEPALALDGGPDGLALIRRLLADAPRVLASRAEVWLEIEYRQGAACAAIARAAFPQARVEVLQDYAGRDRLVAIR